jgi:phosphoribosyl 1,2-cyclic phosphate phosphodiesterase
LNIKITFLGTGTSLGIPIVGCDCTVCRSTDPRDKRLRTSVLIQAAGQNIVIDTGPDFRFQVLRAGLHRLDAVIFTHEHRDHIAGLDDIRPYNYRQGGTIPLYGNEEVIKRIKVEFDYIFKGDYPGIPKVQIHRIDNTPFTIGSLSVIPIQVMHHTMPVFGFRLGDFTYITDANSIPDDEMKKIHGSRFLVINALQREDHPSHFTLDEALEIIGNVNPEKAFLIHMGHNMGLHQQLAGELPPNVFLAYDGLSVELHHA